jgi:peptide/nickel transport system permease protein
MADRTLRSSPAPDVRAGARWQRRLWRSVAKNPLATLSTFLLVAIVLAALFAPYLTEHDPTRLRVRNAFLPPGTPGHLLGTDDLGRDVFSRLLYGARTSLAISLAAAVGAGVIGMLIGLVAGYVRRLDTPLMLVMDGLMAFPSIVLALVVVAVAGRSQANVAIALVIVFGPPIARVVRSSVLVLREMQYVEAAQSLGVSTLRVMARHLLPNALAPWLVQVTLILAFALLTEAGLSFLGLGGNTQHPSWGGMISEARLNLARAPWLTLYPGIAIAVTVLAVNIMADELRDRLDPRLRNV